MEYQAFLDKIELEKQRGTPIKIYNGYTKFNNIHLYTIHKNKKSKIKVTGFEWYFIIDKYACTNNRAFSVLQRNKDAELFYKSERINSRYEKLYCRRAFPKNEFNILKLNLGYIQYNPPITIHQEISEPIIKESAYDTSANGKIEKSFHHLLLSLIVGGIPVYEADVDLLRRFIIDSKIDIYPVDNCLHFDIETDDTVRGFDDLHKKRIISICAKDDLGNKCKFVAKDVDDESEFKLLSKIYPIMKQYSVLEAFNGFFFDFPVLFARLYKYQIERGLGGSKGIDFRQWACQDLLLLFKKHFNGPSEAKDSLSLDNLGDKLLHVPKIALNSKIIDVYHKSKAELLKYNERDVEIQYGLEKKFGFCKLERDLNSISKCFITDHSPGNKIDIMAMDYGHSQNSYCNSRITIKRSGSDKEKKSKYEGAYVMEPKSGFYRDVSCDDFASLYPNTWCAFNIGVDTHLGKLTTVNALKTPSPLPDNLSDLNIDERKKISRAHDEALLQYEKDRLRLSLKAVKSAEDEKIEVVVDSTYPYHKNVINTYIRKNIVITPNGVVFRKTPTTLFSNIFYNLRNKRNEHKALLKEYTNKIESGHMTEENKQKQTYHDNLQTIYKVLANACYGVIGLPSSRFYNPDVAASITLSGQYLIKQARTFAHKDGCEVIYIDTDSLFWQAKNAKYDNNNRLSIRFNEHLKNVIYPRFNIDKDRTFLDLEHEDEFESMVLLSKKRYACKKKGVYKNEDKQYKIMGIEYKRSDKLNLTRTWQKELIQLILSDKNPDLDYYIKWLKDKRNQVIEMNFSIDEFAMSQSCKEVSSYNIGVHNRPHIIIAKILMKRGRFFGGMKVKYLSTGYSGTSSKKKLGVFPFEDYINQEETPIDLKYYWDYKIYKALKSILEVTFLDHDWEKYSFETIRKRKNFYKQVKTKMDRIKDWNIKFEELLLKIENCNNEVKKNKLEIRLAKFKTSKTNEYNRWMTVIGNKNMNEITKNNIKDKLTKLCNKDIIIKDLSNVN